MQDRDCPSEQTGLVLPGFELIPGVGWAVDPVTVAPASAPDGAAVGRAASIHDGWGSRNVRDVDDEMSHIGRYRSDSLKHYGSGDMLKYMNLGVSLALLLLMAGQTPSEQAAGPLRIHPLNPRYFSDGAKRADGSFNVVYLTGSHTWTNLQDVDGYRELTNLEELGGFERHLEWLQSYHHNFIRLWILEHAWDAVEGATIAPLPWPRTGPGHALDGKPKFDVAKFDPAYFDRLHPVSSLPGNGGSMCRSCCSTAGASSMRAPGRAIRFIRGTT